MGDLDEDSGTVTGLPIPVLRTPVGHVLQQLEAVLHYAVLLPTVYVDGHSHPAGVMLVGWVVKTY